MRTACYLSAEYLLGPHLGNNLLNLGAFETAKQAMEELGLDFEKLLQQEEEPGLGNGGLGRLAACYLDSLATLEIPSIGYGIRYEFGIFDQLIRDGWQVEMADKWLHLGNPWEIARPEIAMSVGFGGHTEPYTDENGRYRVRWIPARLIKGIAYDTPIPGYRVNTANLLRLWSAEAVDSFDLEAFNIGAYCSAVEQKVASETISKVLYPNDTPPKGKRLRLEQQYFLVSCALQDMMRIHLQTAPDAARFHEKYAVQLNDTHPALAVAEMMRILVDDHGMDWDAAWDITRQTMAYTNHTLLPEALEKWSVDLFGRVLPRHLGIVYEINRRLLEEVRSRHPGDHDRVRRLSLIENPASGRSGWRISRVRDLGVRYVLEGSVRKAGNRVRITAQLVEAATGAHLWGERYDRDLADAFAVQDEITDSVVGAIEPELRQVEQQRAVRKSPEAMDAWDHHMRGMWRFHQFNPEDNVKAERLMRQAIDVDPRFTSGYVGLARVFTQRIVFEWSEDPDGDRRAAYAAARRAVELDEKDAYTHYVHAWASLLMGEHEYAIAEAQKSIDLTPNFALGYYMLGVARVFRGRFEQATDPFQRAMRLSPHEALTFFFCYYSGLAQYHQGNYEEAARMARMGIAIRPTHMLYRTLAASYGQLGRIEEARTALGEMLGLMPKAAERLWDMMNPYFDPAHRAQFIDGLHKAGWTGWRHER